MGNVISKNRLIYALLIANCTLLIVFKSCAVEVGIEHGISGTHSGIAGSSVVDHDSYGDFGIIIRGITDKIGMV